MFSRGPGVAYFLRPTGETTRTSPPKANSVNITNHCAAEYSRPPKHSLPVHFCAVVRNVVLDGAAPFRGGGRILVYPPTAASPTYLDIFVDEWHFEGGEHERHAKRKGRTDPVQIDEPDERAHHGECGAYGPSSFCVNPPVRLLRTITKQKYSSSVAHHEGGWVGDARKGIFVFRFFSKDNWKRLVLLPFTGQRPRNYVS